MRILIDDSLFLESGNKAETYLEYADTQPPECSVSNPDVLAMELSYAPIKGISGYRLVEEEILPDGSRNVTQEFILAPDIAYALFKHWQALDAQVAENLDEEGEG